MGPDRISCHWHHAIGSKYLSGTHTPASHQAILSPSPHLTEPCTVGGTPMSEQQWQLAQDHRRGQESQGRSQLQLWAKIHDLRRLLVTFKPHSLICKTGSRCHSWWGGVMLEADVKAPPNSESLYWVFISPWILCSALGLSVKSSFRSKSSYNKTEHLKCSK